MIVDQKKVNFNFVGGNDFIAYTTTRKELLARNSIPGGAKRVEWRYDPNEQKLNRTVSMLLDGKREPVAPVETSFLPGLESFEIYFFDGVDWLRLTGISELMPQTVGISVRFVFAANENTDQQEFIESAIILPNETFKQE
jgi:hypothetical protein